MQTATAQQFEHLKKWTRPNSYIGEQYPEFYVVYGQHRDSDLLTQSNFDAIKAALTEAQSAEGIPDSDEASVQIVSSSHWAVGWVETILVHESDGAALEKAEELLSRIADYPVLDDEDYYRREEENARQTWEVFDIGTRVEYLKRARMNIFAARRDEMPYDEDGYLTELLTND